MSSQHKALGSLLHAMEKEGMFDARKPVVPLHPACNVRVYLVAVAVPRGRNAEPPGYKRLEKALHPAAKQIGAKWVKAQGYEDYRVPEKNI